MQLSALVLALVRCLEAARGPRDYAPVPLWFGYIEGTRYGLVRLFRLPLAVRDQLGLPKQAWVWNAYMRLYGDTMHIEGAKDAPPIAGLRSLLVLAWECGATYLTLDRLKGNVTVTRTYNLAKILGRLEYSGQDSEGIRGISG